MKTVSYLILVLGFLISGQVAADSRDDTYSYDEKPRFMRNFKAHINYLENVNVQIIEPKPKAKTEKNQAAQSKPGESLELKLIPAKKSPKKS